MKFKQKKSTKTLSEKIADALTVKPKADIEDDQVFGTKPQTLSRGDFSSSESEDDTAISDFRKRNINLLSEISKKYEGQVVSRKDLKRQSLEQSEDGEEQSDSDGEVGNIISNLKASINRKSDSEVGSDSENEVISNGEAITESEDDSVESDDYSITKLQKKPAGTDENSEAEDDDENDDSDDGDESDDYISSSITKLQNKPVGSDERSKAENDDLNDDSDDGDESDDHISSSITKLQKKPAGSSKAEVDDENDDSDDGDEGDDDEEGYDISQLEEPMQEDFEHVKKENISEEAKKGACVRNQLLLWEGLLEMRIHLQRCLNTANQMPLPDTFEELKTDEEFLEETKVTKTNVANVLDKLLSLQDMLFNKFPETKTLSTNKSQQSGTPEAKLEGSDEEIPSDTEDEEIPSDTDEENDVKTIDKKSAKNTPTNNRKRKLEDYENEMAVTHKVFKPFRDATIQKWNDKTRVATAANIKHAPTNTILQQISYILSDKNKLIRRTQLKRSEYDIIGYKKEQKQDENMDENDTNPVMRDRKENDEYIPEIFDDNDFYHQLLRELIECKSADISDPVQLSRQWIALQQMRSKMKRKVDTKATKGRKIKYVVHSKLVNYMAPEKCTTWTDESTNELYSSLFGKLFEHNNVGINAKLENGTKIK